MGITLIFDRNCDKMEGSLFDISALQKIHREGRRCLPGAIPYRERRVRERKTAGLPLTHKQWGRGMTADIPYLEAFTLRSVTPHPSLPPRSTDHPRRRSKSRRCAAPNRGSPPREGNSTIQTQNRSFVSNTNTHEQATLSCCQEG